MEKLLEFTKNVEVEKKDGEYIIIAVLNDQSFETRSESYNDAINTMIEKFNKKETIDTTSIKSELEAMGKLIFTVTDQTCFECDPPQYYTEGMLEIGTLAVKGNVNSFDQNALFNKLLVSLYDVVIAKNKFDANSI